MCDARDYTRIAGILNSVLAACMYLEIRVLKRKGRLFILMLSFVWLF